MDSEKQAEFVRVYIQMREAAGALCIQAQEVCEMARDLEELTRDTLISHAGLQVKVVAGATRSEAQDLLSALDELSTV